MEAIAELEHEYFLLRFGWGEGERCVDWAVDRLGNDDEGDDLEIVLLASARGRDEVLPLVEVIVARYCGTDGIKDEFFAGRYVASLRGEVSDEAKRWFIISRGIDAETFERLANGFVQHRNPLDLGEKPRRPVI